MPDAVEGQMLQWRVLRLYCWQVRSRTVMRWYFSWWTSIDKLCRFV